MWDSGSDEHVVWFKVDGTEIGIPKINSLDTEIQEINNFERTAGGQLKGTIITYKRRWTFETAPLSPSVADDIISELESVYFGIIEFKTDEMSDYVDGKVSLTDIERVQFGERGNWYKDGKQLSFEVEEV